MSFEQLTASVDALAATNADLKNTVITVQVSTVAARDDAQAHAVDSLAAAADSQAQKILAQTAATAAANSAAQAVIDTNAAAQAKVDTLALSTGASKIGTKLSDTGSVLRNVGVKVQELKKSPMDFGAVGDGVANDTAAWLLTETAVGTGGSIFLPAGKIFSLAIGTQPARNIEGPGQVLIGGVPFTDLSMNYDLFRTSLYFIPPNYSDVIAFPGGNGNMTVMISPGAKRLGNTNRCTFLGTQGPKQTINLDRCEGIGNGALMFTKYAERATAIGTIAFQYLGCTSPQTDGHGWWGDAGGFIPGQIGWDYQGMETRNPGIGAKIAAFTGFATQSTDVGRSVAVGRDAFNGTPVATGSVAIGYRAGAGCFSVSNLSCIGSDAFRDGVFQYNSIAAGTFAGNQWQEGNRNAVFGYNAAGGTIRGANNTLLGSYAGYDYADLNGCILIGTGGGNALGGTALTDTLAIGQGTASPLISGNLTALNVGVNIAPSKIKGTLHVRTNDFGADIAANSAADELIVENSTGCGITIRSGAAGGGNLLFANPTTQNIGGIIYSNSANTMTFRVNAGDRWKMDNASFNPASDNALSVGTASLRPSVIYAATSTISTSDGTLKLERGELTDQELKAWSNVRQVIFQFKDSLAVRGVNARLHTGHIAQQVQKAFEDGGLDVSKYALWCEDDVTVPVIHHRTAERQQETEQEETIQDIQIIEGVPTLVSYSRTRTVPVFKTMQVVDSLGAPIFDSEGEPRVHAVPVMEEYEEEYVVQESAGKRLGLRYEQCLVFETAYLRQRLASIESRIEILEAK